MAASPACARALAHGAGRDRRGGHRPPACAAAAAPASRPASSGAPCSTQPATQKYVVCNADEGDSGTFADRMLMEGDPFLLIEGMAIAGFAVGATRGLRLHPLRVPATPSRQMQRGDRCAHGSRGWLGDDVLGSGPRLPPRRPPRRRRLHLRRGDLDAGEPRGQARHGPRSSRRCRRSRACSASRPSSTTCSRWPPCRSILADGAAAYARLRHGPLARHACRSSSPATSRRGGLVEKAFGLTLRELIDDFGGGTASGRPVRAVQVGGPLGAYLPGRACSTCRWTTRRSPPPSAHARPWRHRGVRRHGRHGRAGALRDGVLRRSSRCGKCTPCRIGSTRGVETHRQDHRAASERDAEPALLDDLCEVMTDGSLCAHGRAHADAGAQRAHAFPRGLLDRAPMSRRSGVSEIRSHDPISGNRPRHPGRAQRRRDRRRSTIDGQPVTVAGGHLGHARRRRWPASTCPSCAPPTASRPFGSCRLCLVEIDGRKGTPASCTTPVAPGMQVTHPVAAARASCAAA